MTQLKHAIEIEKPVAEVYALAQQVERYPEFMKDYLSSRIVERSPLGDVVERSARVKGKHYVWKSRVLFRENKGVYFTHLEGPLHGMQVRWELDALSAQRTRLMITHQFQIHHAVPFWGRLMERWYFRPNINDIAGRVIVSFKQACETAMSKKEEAVTCP